MLQRLQAYAELLRISNVLTAVADVWMGMIVATGSLSPLAISGPLTLASVFIYLSGMVLNDVFDAKRDARERPSRPLPSGRVTRQTATTLGAGLMSAGWLSAAVTANTAQNWSPLVVASLLVVCVLVYNSSLKETPLAPLAMGACRALNASLGVWLGSSTGNTPTPLFLTFTVAFGVLLYVTGLTMFARNEAATNRRMPLIGASLLSGVALSWLAGASLELGGLAGGLSNTRWLVLWGVIALLIARRYVAAILQPTPKHIQAAVGNAIQSIILIDAALAWGYVGPYWGLAIFALLPPTMLMARFIRQT